MAAKATPGGPRQALPPLRSDPGTIRGRFASWGADWRAAPVCAGPLEKNPASSRGFPSGAAGSSVQAGRSGAWKTGKYFLDAQKRRPMFARTSSSVPHRPGGNGPRTKQTAGRLSWQDKGLPVEGTIEVMLFRGEEATSTVPFFVGTGTVPFGRKHGIHLLLPRLADA